MIGLSEAAPTPNPAPRGGELFLVRFGGRPPAKPHHWEGDGSSAQAYSAVAANKMSGLRDFVGYGQPSWLLHTGQAQGQPVHMVSTP